MRLFRNYISSLTLSNFIPLMIYKKASNTNFTLSNFNIYRITNHTICAITFNPKTCRIVKFKTKDQANVDN